LKGLFTNASAPITDVEKLEAGINDTDLEASFDREMGLMYFPKFEASDFLFFRMNFIAPLFLLPLFLILD